MVSLMSRQFRMEHSQKMWTNDSSIPDEVRLQHVAQLDRNSTMIRQRRIDRSSSSSEVRSVFSLSPGNRPKMKIFHIIAI